MHEASIALSILDAVIGHCLREGYPEVESVRVKVGRGSNVLPEALSFAFDAAKKETIAADAKLVIEESALTAVCMRCGKKSEPEDKYVVECSACPDGLLRIISGCEMELLEMEVKEPGE